MVPFVCVILELQFLDSIVNGFLSLSPVVGNYLQAHLLMRYIRLLMHGSQFSLFPSILNQHLILFWLYAVVGGVGLAFE